jgi:hypothetical protein
MTVLVVVLVAVLDEVGVREPVCDGVRLGNTLIVAAEVEVGVFVLDAVGVGVDVERAVLVPVILLVVDNDGVTLADVQRERLDVWDGVCEPVIVFEGELVIDGVIVDEPVPDNVSEQLIVTVGSAVGVDASLPVSDCDAHQEKVEVGVKEEEEETLIVVVVVSYGDIVGVAVPEGVIVDVGVCVVDVDGDDSMLGDIDGDAYIERLGVADGVIEPDNVEEALDVPEGEFDGDRVPVGVMIALMVVDGVSMEEGLSLPLWEEESPNESVVVGDTVWDELMLIDEEGVDNGEVVEVAVPLIVAVGEGVWVGDEEGVDSALDVIDGEAPDERLAVDEGVIKPDNVEELLNVPDGEFEGDGVPVGVMLALMVVDGVTIAVGLSLPLWEADKPNESVVVGVLEEEELTLTVVEGVWELVPDVVGVEVPVSEPLDVCDGVVVPVGLPEEVGVTEFVAIAVPVTCDDAVNKLLFAADTDTFAVILVVLVPTIPLSDATDE